MPNVSNLTRFYISRFDEAWEKFENNEVQEAEDIASDLFLKPELPLGLRAGLHILLAYGDENYVWHAGQAVFNWEQVVRARPDNPRYKAALEQSRAQLEAAEEDQEAEDEEENAKATAQSAKATDQTAAITSQTAETTDQTAAPPGEVTTADAGQAKVPTPPGVVKPAGPLEAPAPPPRPTAASTKSATTESPGRTAASDRPKRSGKQPMRF